MGSKLCSTRTSTITVRTARMMVWPHLGLIEVYCYKTVMKLRIERSPTEIFRLVDVRLPEVVVPLHPGQLIRGTTVGMCAST